MHFLVLPRQHAAGVLKAHRKAALAANLGLEQLAATLAALEQLCAGSDAAAAQQRGAAAATLQAQWPAAGTLLQALRRGELDDVAQAQLHSAMGAQTPPLVALAHAIDDFDFPLAQSLRHDLLQSFETDAVAYLQAQKGRHFEPHLVDLFVQEMPAIDAIRLR